MLVKVQCFSNDTTNTVIAMALVEAETFLEAHQIAMRLIGSQYPHVDPAVYNQTMCDEIRFRGEN